MKATTKPAPFPSPEAWLSPSDLDEAIAKRAKLMAKRLAGSGSVPDYLSEPNTKRFTAARKELSSVKNSAFVESVDALLLCATMLFVCSPLIAFVHGIKHQSIVSDVPLPAFLAVFFLTVQIVRSKLHHRRKEALYPDAPTVAKALPLLNHDNPVEKAYCEAAAALLLEPPSAWGGPQAVKHLLHDLRDLFQVGKQTSSKRAQIEQAMSHQSLVEVDAEATRLTQRILAATDEKARATLQQSLAHLEARRARVRAMEPLRERLEAQEEAVYQALREAQTTLSSPVWISESDRNASETPTVPAATSWSETAARLRQQTHAVEAAVQEVMQVGVGKNSG